MEKYLVLGGGGFLGKAIVHQLSNHCNVRVFDRFKVPEFDEISTVEVVTGDFQTQQFDELLDGVDGVIHLVSTTVPNDDTSIIPTEIEQNVIPTVRLLESMVRCGVNKILFSSSAGTVYGETGDHVNSTGDPLNPQCSYGMQKKVIEGYLQFYGVRYGIDYRIMRITNPYGCGQNPNKMQGLIPIFINRLLNGDPITIFGDGTNQRDYIYIHDVAVAVEKVMHYTGNQHIFNIGYGEVFSINEIINILEKESGLHFVNIARAPDRLCDVHKSIVDTKSTQDELDWYPKVDLLNGIQITLNLLRNK